MSELIAAVGAATPTVAVTGVGLAALKTIVGPTAKVFGSTMAEFVEYRLQNWLGIARAAERALGEDPPDGQVHPRVVHQVLEEGTFLDDPVMQSYVGGLLAAARTPEGADDRAAYYVRLVSGLTANQVALHHAVYAEIASVERSPESEIGDSRQQHRYSVHVGLQDAHDALVTPLAGEAADPVFSEVVSGLDREGLVSSAAVGGPELLARGGIAATEPSLVVCASSLGALLFLWAHGVRGADANLIGHVPLRELAPAGPRLRAARVGPWNLEWDRDDYGSLWASDDARL